MEAAGLSLAVIGTAEQCLKIGRELVKKYRAYENAEEDVAEQVLILQNHWFRMDSEIDLVRKVCRSIGEDLQRHFARLFAKIEARLQEATILLDSVIGQTRDDMPSFRRLLGKKGKLRKGAFVLTVKDSLDQVMAELKKWHDMLEQAFYLLNRSSSQDLSYELSKQPLRGSGPGAVLRSMRTTYDDLYNSDIPQASIFLSSDFLATTRTKIRFSASECAQESQTTKRVIVDDMVCDPPIKNDRFQSAVRDLARKLSKIGPANSGLLQCRGVVKDETPEGQVSRITFIFSIPPGNHHLRSLRSLLMDGNLFYPLDQRLELTRHLARSIMYLHIAKFIHKNVRPETIVVLPKKNSMLGSAYLVGFEKFRPVEGKSTMVGDSLWYKDIYRHPNRQGARPDEEYIMQHDIYSLGVCLLEIGLWATFVNWEDDGKGASVGRGFDLTDHLSGETSSHLASQAKRSLEVLSSGKLLGEIEESEREFVEDWRRRAFAIKKVFVALATDILPSRMGQKYADITRSCLTCLDEHNRDFGDESDLKDEDGLLVGTRYMEKVSFQLQEISI